MVSSNGWRFSDIPMRGAQALILLSRASDSRWNVPAQSCIALSTSIVRVLGGTGERSGLGLGLRLLVVTEEGGWISEGLSVTVEAVQGYCHRLRYAEVVTIWRPLLRFVLVFLDRSTTASFIVSSSRLIS